MGTHLHASPIRWLKRVLSFALISGALLSSSAPAAFVPPAYLKASNTGDGDTFGLAVAASGDTLVIGAPGEDDALGIQGNEGAPEAGAVYVFIRNGTNWTQQALLKASNAEGGDGFGSSVAVSGDTLVVGAPGEGSSAAGVNGNQSNNDAPNAGAAYVFVRSGSSWSRQAYLKASNPEEEDRFGSTVAVSGDTVVVSAPQEDSQAVGVNGNPSLNDAPNAGAAYVFVRSGSTWSQQGYLKASNPEEEDRFGSAVAVSGDTVVVSAAQEDSQAVGVNGNPSLNDAPNAGAAYVFVRSGSSWSQQAYLKASNAEEEDRFGSAVAVSGDTVVVSAPQEDSQAVGVNGNPSLNDAPNAGAAYVFVRSDSSWSQQAYLKASNPEEEDRFGGAVAISGDTVVVSAAQEDGQAVGVNGNASLNEAPNAGAAYVFVRSGSTWSQQAYLKASNPEEEDRFGGAVAISGDTVVVGAPQEDSQAVGAYGNASLNDAPDAGSAYVFVRQGSGPWLTLSCRDGKCWISLDGVPGYGYVLDRSAGLFGPWLPIATNTAPASGILEFLDAAPLPGQGFYRAVTP